MNKKYYSIIVVIALALVLLAGYWFLCPESPALRDSGPVTVMPAEVSSPELTPTPAISPLSDISSPLDRAADRVSKKKFGQYITPANSPVQPERFSGYHTGLDFEIFPEELNQDVAVKAICSGQLERKEKVSGYGGVAIQSCTLDGDPVTVIYGHLDLASISSAVGDSLPAGKILAELGADQSSDTAGERQHLHLGIHRGTAVDVRGYLAEPGGLNAWIDPCQYVCF